MDFAGNKQMVSVFVSLGG